MTSNIRFVSADWTVTESGADISRWLVTCDGQGSFHRFKRAHGTDQMELVASGVPPAGALPRDFERTRLRVEEESTFVLTNDGSAIMFSGVDYSSISARMDAANHEAIIDAKCGTGGEWLLLSNESGVSAFTPQSGGRQTTPRRRQSHSGKRRLVLLPRSIARASPRWMIPMPLTAFDASSRIISRVTPDRRDKRSRAYTGRAHL